MLLEEKPKNVIGSNTMDIFNPINETWKMEITRTCTLIVNKTPEFYDRNLLFYSTYFFLYKYELNKKH